MISTNWAYLTLKNGFKIYQMNKNVLKRLPNQQEGCLPEAQRKCLPCDGSSISINSTSLCFAGRNKTLCISSLRRDDITGERKRRIEIGWWEKALKKKRIWTSKAEREVRGKKWWGLWHWTTLKPGSGGQGGGDVSSGQTAWKYVVVCEMSSYSTTHTPLCSSQVWWSMLIFD